MSALPELQLVLAAIEPALADAWRTYCGDVPGLSVHEGSIFDVACDAVVSPANSFGFMDGGIDLAYMEVYGEGIQALTSMLVRVWCAGVWCALAFGAPPGIRTLNLRIKSP